MRKTLALAAGLTLLAGTAMAVPYASQIRIADTNPQPGSSTTISYVLNMEAEATLIEVLDEDSTIVASFAGTTDWGLNTVTWDLTGDNSGGTPVPEYEDLRIRISVDGDHPDEWQWFAINRSPAHDSPSWWDEPPRDSVNHAYLTDTELEQFFTGADWFERELGEGVVWRNYEFDHLFGERQSISYVEVDLDASGVEIELPYLATGLQRTSTMVPNQAPDAVAAINGTYFNPGESGHNTYLRIDGTVVPHKTRTKGAWGHHGGLVQDNLGSWDVVQMPSTSGQWDDDTDHPTIMANGPLLVLGGSIAQSQINSAGGTHCTARHPRTAVGVTADNRLIMLTVDGRTDRGGGMTCNETAQVLLWLGVENGVNMDGGGTTTMWVAGEPSSGVVNYPSDAGGERGTANAIAVVANPPATPAYDATLLSMSHGNITSPGGTTTVTITYQNTGTETWTQSNTRLVTARPAEHASSLATGSWVSPSQPTLMSQSSVATGQSATFQFQVMAPDDDTPGSFTQYFMLVQDGVGRIGPHDGKAWLNMTVTPAMAQGDALFNRVRAHSVHVPWDQDRDDFGLVLLTSSHAAGTFDPGHGMVIKTTSDLRPPAESQDGGRDTSVLRTPASTNPASLTFEDAWYMTPDPLNPGYYYVTGQGSVSIWHGSLDDPMGTTVMGAGPSVRTMAVAADGTDRIAYLAHGNSTIDRGVIGPDNQLSQASLQNILSLSNTGLYSKHVMLDADGNLYWLSRVGWVYRWPAAVVQGASGASPLTEANADWVIDGTGISTPSGATLYELTDTPSGDIIVSSRSGLINLGNRADTGVNRVLSDSDIFFAFPAAMPLATTYASGLHADAFGNIYFTDGSTGTDLAVAGASPGGQSNTQVTAPTSQTVTVTTAPTSVHQWVIFD